MDALQEETGTWPAAYWFLRRASGTPDHVSYPSSSGALILFSSEERAARFHDDFPTKREGCTPEAISPARVPALVTQHFRPGSVRAYVLDPSAEDFDEDFDEAGRQRCGLSHWPLTLVGLCGYLPV